MNALEIVPVTLKAAATWVGRYHRHHRPLKIGLFAIGVAQDGDMVGVAVVARPAARHLADGWTVEVARVCVLEGHPNACSKLYSACWRAARAMGYRKAITYILGDEPGTSVSAAGWKCIGEAGGGSWNRAARPRIDDQPMQRKLRWEVATA